MRDLKKYWVKKSAFTMSAKFHSAEKEKVIEITISDDADAADEITTAMMEVGYAAAERARYRDKNGRHIFDGDIVDLFGETLIVRKLECGFVVKDKKMTRRTYLSEVFSDCEIIGNGTENAWLVD